MLVINTSEVLADLLPEVCHTLDPDEPLHDDALPLAVRRYMKGLILHAFLHVLRDDLKHHQEWLTRIRQDRFLSAVSNRHWIDVEVMDIEGTFVLNIGELDHDHRLYR